MQSLFSELNVVDQIAQALVDLRVSPVLRHVFERFHQQGRLANLLKVVIKKGKANNTAEALSYLAEVVTDEDPSRINLGDFNGNRGLQGLNRLMRRHGLIDSEEDELSVASLFLGPYGVTGHLLAVALAQKRPLPLVAEEQILSIQGMQQLSLFAHLEYSEAREIRQLPLFTLEQAASVFPDAIQGDWVSDGHLYRIQACLASITTTFRLNRSWLVQYTSMQPLLREMRMLLGALFAPFLARLRFSKDPAAEYFELITLMTWARMLIFYAGKSAGLIFSEVPALDVRNGLSAGRMDAVEIEVYGRNKVIRSKRVRTMTQATKLRPFRSVGELYIAVRAQAGSEIRMRVVDYKFQAGDGLELDKIIHSRTVRKQPLTKHKNQGDRYSALVSFELGRCGVSKIEDVFDEVVLMYLLSDRKPILHQILSSSINAQAVLTERFGGDKWQAAHQQAAKREVASYIVGHIVDLMKDRPQRVAKLSSPTLGLEGAYPVLSRLTGAVV